MKSRPSNSGSHPEPKPLPHEKILDEPFEVEDVTHSSSLPSEKSKDELDIRNEQDNWDDVRVHGPSELERNDERIMPRLAGSERTLQPDGPLARRLRGRTQMQSGYFSVELQDSKINGIEEDPPEDVLPPRMKRKRL